MDENKQCCEKCKYEALITMSFSHFPIRRDCSKCPCHQEAPKVDTKEAAKRIGEQFGPAIKKLGSEGEPEAPTGDPEKRKVCPNGYHSNKDSDCSCDEKFPPEAPTVDDGTHHVTVSDIRPSYYPNIQPPTEAPKVCDACKFQPGGVVPTNDMKYCEKCGRDLFPQPLMESWEDRIRVENGFAKVDDLLEFIRLVIALTRNEAREEELEWVKESAIECLLLCVGGGDVGEAFGKLGELVHERLGKLTQNK